MRIRILDRPGVPEEASPIFVATALVACALFAMGPLHGCGGVTKANQAGAGGAGGGSGGSTASGGITTPITGNAFGGGGSTNPIAGTGGIGPSAGGMGAGGKATGGIGAGGIGAGGTIGTVSVATGGIGAGGIGAGGIMLVGTGGMGAGGIGTGGAPSTDAGAADAPPPACSELTTAGDCYYRGDCYTVYKSEQNCGCATAGCCTQFDHCAEGRLADCTGPALCDMATPYCEPPYVGSYKNGCYEGCVQQYDCPVPACPATAPKDGTACESVDHKCYYEDCVGAGRTMASCAGGLWAVENGACTPVDCPGGGITPAGTTCAAGEVCVRTTSTGGAYTITASCTQQICGTGPVSVSCIQLPYSGCFANTSLSGIVVNCSASSSCGSGQGGCQ